MKLQLEDKKLLQCLLCEEKFTLIDVKNLTFFPSTGICNKCYQQGQKDEYQEWCFGKESKYRNNKCRNNKIVEFGYNPKSAECSKQCKDREICKLFILLKEKENMARRNEEDELEDIENEDDATDLEDVEGDEEETEEEDEEEEKPKSKKKKTTKKSSEEDEEEEEEEAPKKKGKKVVKEKVTKKVKKEKGERKSKHVDGTLYREGSGIAQVYTMLSSGKSVSYAKLKSTCGFKKNSQLDVQLNLIGQHGRWLALGKKTKSSWKISNDGEKVKLVRE